jgi:hypothetical protein
MVVQIQIVVVTEVIPAVPAVPNPRINGYLPTWVRVQVQVVVPAGLPML